MSQPNRIIKATIPHTWPLFFTRYGNFTAVQSRAIPNIVTGNDTLVIAATASGKTAAVLAPLIERYWTTLTAPQKSLTLLYICPTRALVRDLHDRLRDILANTGIPLAMKTGDVGALGTTLGIVIMTPESADSLLTRNPRLFITLQAIIVDEIHLFDNAPRGDHLRCLLPRIERIRSYADPDNTRPMQRVLLSATVPDPEGLAQRYLHEGRIVEIAGQRHIDAHIAPLYDLNELLDRLSERAARKTLLFCNSREEVEKTAAWLRERMPHEAQVFVHYGNLDGKLRYEIETEFAAASVAVCVTTSTLELGIDIGSVEDVVLLGAPPTLTSFLQRIGRGSRRSNTTHVLCLPKSPAEWARFDGLLALATGHVDDVESAESYHFRPSVLIQQIFSLTKQSPTGSIRLGDVRRLAPATVSSEAVRQIVSELVFQDYLQRGRIGEWKPAALLQELIDHHEIYSNIGADVLSNAAIDAYTNRVIAYTDRMPDVGTVVLFGGKVQRVVWHGPRRFGLAPAPHADVDEVLRYRSVQAAIPFQITQAVARELGLHSGQMATLPTESGMWLFHFCGSIWGELLTRLLDKYAAEFVNEFAIYLHSPIETLPPWDSTSAETTARSLARIMSDRLNMGRFHALLPHNVAIDAATAQIEWEAFGRFYQTVTLIPGGPINESLYGLLR